MNKSATKTNGGWILVAVGVLFLLNQTIQIDLPAISELLFLPAIATAFIVSASATRKVGLLIPGGILYGVGATAFIDANPFEWSFVQRVDEAALFFFCFALGWASITLFSLLLDTCVQWWALVVAAIFAFIGLAISVEGVFLDLLQYFSKGWPAVLIFIGLWSIFGRRTYQEK